MSRGCIAASILLVWMGGCAWQGPVLAQAPASDQNRSPVQLQSPREDRADPPPSAKPPTPPGQVAPSAKPPTPPGQVAVRICADVNDMPILDDEVRQAMQPYLAAIHSLPEPERSVRLQEAKRRELDKLIERELIYSDAMNRLKKNPKAIDKLKEAAGKEFEKQLRAWRDNLNRQGLKIESEDDLKPILKMQGLTLDFLQRKNERDFISREYMMNRVWPQVDKIGHKEVRQYYEAHPGEFQAEDKVQWLHIFIGNTKPEHPDQAAARRFAEEIIRQVNAGGDFVKMAERYDDGFSKFSHGEGTGKRRGEIRPIEAEPYLFRMREGDIGPVLEVPTGCHIFKLVSREYAGLLPFDESTQLMVKRKLQNMVLERETRRFVEELKRKAAIKYFDNY